MVAAQNDEISSCSSTALRCIFTSFVAASVVAAKRMGTGQVSDVLRITEYIFLYCCAAFAVRGAGFYVNTFLPLPAFCSLGGFWLAAMQTWIPLTTSFLFLAVMWRSGVAELRSFSLEVVQSLSEFSVGMEDVPGSSGWGNNPMSQQSGNDGQLVELTLHP